MTVPVARHRFTHPEDSGSPDGTLAQDIGRRSNSGGVKLVSASSLTVDRSPGSSVEFRRGQAAPNLTLDWRVTACLQRGAREESGSVLVGLRKSRFWFFFMSGVSRHVYVCLMFSFLCVCWVGLSVFLPLFCRSYPRKLLGEVYKCVENRHG